MESFMQKDYRMCSDDGREIFMKQTKNEQMQIHKRLHSVKINEIWISKIYI